MGAKAELVRRLFEADDPRPVAEALLADDAVWHSPGDLAISGDFQGKASIIEYMNRSFDQADQVSFELHDVLESDDHVVVLAEEHAERSGESFDSPYCYVFHVSGDKITEGWTFPYDEQRRAAFFNR